MSRSLSRPTKLDPKLTRNAQKVVKPLRFLSRAEQVAGYLREQLAGGALVEPLPGMRAWSRKLGVSRSTLDAAMKLLQREQWIRITAHGVALRQSKPLARKRSARPRIRWLLEGAQQIPPQNYLTLAGLVQNRVRLKGIDVDWEYCRPARLREIARSRAVGDDLFILASLRPTFQRLFRETKKSSLVLGEVAAGLDLPFVNADLSGSVRHAVFQLLRAGCTRVELIHPKHPAAGIANAALAFGEAVQAWPAAVPARVHATALDRPSLLATMGKVVATRSTCVGYVVVAPVPVGMVVSALLAHGYDLPKQAKVAAVFHAEDAVRLYSPLLHYPWPGQALGAKIGAMAEHYFATGKLPRSRTLIPEMTRLE